MPNSERRPSVTLRAPMHVGELMPVGGAGWSRCRRPEASQSPRRSCSRTTSQDAGASEAAVGDLDAPREPDRAEHRLLIVPPDPAHLEVMVPAERAGSGRGDPTIHQDQLKAPGNPLLGQVLQHQLTGPVLMGGGRHDQGTHRKPGHVDRHHALGAVRGAVRAAAVVEGEPAPLGPPRARCVSMTTIDGVASARPPASRAAAYNTVNARVQVPLRDQRRNCDHTRVHGPNDSGG